MKVDVQTEIVIDRPVAEVASYAADPANAPKWYANIESIEWHTAPSAAVGSKITFVARFLGRRLEYVYEVVELTPGKRLVMRRANRKDLARIKSMRESSTPSTHFGLDP